MGDFYQFNINGTPPATRVVTAGGGPYLLLNNDNADTVYLGTANTADPTTFTVGPLPPGAFLSFDGTEDIYAITIGSATAQVIAYPTAGMFFSPAVAALIAQQLQVSIVGNPQLMFNVSPSISGLPSCLVGNTIPPNAFKPTCYDAGLSQSQSDSQFVSIVQRGNAGHLAVTKKYWPKSPGNVVGGPSWDTTANDLANYQKFGTKVIVCINPFFTAGLPAGTGNGTATDLTNLQNFLNGLTALGFTPQTVVLDPWQEPADLNKKMSAVDYGNMLKFYGPTINASGFPLVINVNYVGSAIHFATDYIKQALAIAGAAGVQFAAVAMDWYYFEWSKNLLLDTPDANGDSVSSLCIANNLPLGLYECGVVPSKAGQSNTASYMLGKDTGILGFFSNWIANGHTPYDILYYDGDCAADGSGALSSPIGQDPTLPNDYRIGYYQQIFDAFTVSPGTGLTIAPNTTVTIKPENKSPGGGLAPAAGLSYEAEIALTAGIGSTNPFAQVTINFFDFDQPAKTQNPVQPITILCPMGANGDPNGPAVTIGSGFLRGAFANMKVINYDSVTCTVSYLQVVGTGRNSENHIWTWNCSSQSSPAIPGFTLAQAAPNSGQIGRITGVTINPGITKTFLCGMFSGKAFVRFNASGTTGPNANYQLQPVPSNVFSVQNILNENVAGSEFVLPGVGLLFAPSLLSITNNEATAVIQASAQLIAQPY